VKDKGGEEEQRKGAERAIGLGRGRDGTARQPGRRGGEETERLGWWRRERRGQGAGEWKQLRSRGRERRRGR
jgi:hypothetical protein